MRLEPSEEFMYRRMDWKERLLLLFPLLGIGASVGLLLIAGGKQVLGIGVTGGGLCLMIGVWIGYLELKKRIMPLNQCFLEIQSDCFVAVQPFRDGEYETCKIYFDEIESVIEGKRGKGFYIRISGDGKSVVQRKERGRVMFVSSKGYEREKFGVIHEKIKERRQGR